MFKNSLPCIIIIIFSTKSCVNTFGIPALHLKFKVPNLNSSLITKPILSLYQTPLSAVNVLHSANSLNYLVPSSNPLQNLNDARYFPFKSFESRAGIVSPYIQNVAISTMFPYYNTQKKLVNAEENFSTSTTEMITTVSPVQRKRWPKYDLMEFSPQVSRTANHFMQVLEQLNSKFYQVSFGKLMSISPAERRENGITFAQSGLFLYLQLMAICTESDAQTVMEIKQSLGLETTCAEQVPLLKDILSTLPKSNEFLKFHWSSRFVLGPQFKFSEKFIGETAPDLHVSLDHLNETESPRQLTKHLNHMIDADSLWAMHDTFEEEELSKGVCAAWLMTMYVRARWRSAPTVLNGTRLFYDGDAPPRHIRMIRINDVMRYAHLEEWDAEAIEIRYATRDLTLTILLPRSRSLRNLTDRMSAENLRIVYENMQMKRVAVILPIYTLRMTLLLPGKLEKMGLSRLIDPESGAGCKSLKLSHSVQRIMFWAEAGRNAFKDDGIEWDEAPEHEIVVDRPYIFFVRWRNKTLLNGNFVL